MTDSPAEGREVRRLSACTAYLNSCGMSGREQYAPLQRLIGSGRAVAFMMDDALLAGEMAKAKKPTDWAVTGTPQSYEIYGCMLRT